MEVAAVDRGAAAPDEGGDGGSSSDSAGVATARGDTSPPTRLLAHSSPKSCRNHPTLCRESRR
ncbi:hypothetical protein [Oryza sativa Japonica Group]|uniref:Uncharacterized protein P0454A11.4 n=1 Tax=Oryza sativa subsp. japonica TaxID=39947 RepID=Q943B8_ORYSJ|nr:hypothetical protein [Oryza sativa Japonica Group]